MRVLLDWMVYTLDYIAYFQDSYGKREHTDESIYGDHFVSYVTQLNRSPAQRLNQLAKLDITQDKLEDELVIIATIFRTKSLEYGYVFLLECDDKLLSYLKGECTDVIDNAGFELWTEFSSYDHPSLLS